MKITREQRDAWKENTADDAFNQWFNPQIASADVKLDLEAMYGVAKRYGVTARYDDLNPGQQRMNIGNALRKVVPPSEYQRAAPADPT